LGWADFSPVIAQKVSAPDHEIARRKVFVDGIGARQSGNSEKRRRRAGFAKGGSHRANAFVDLFPCLDERHLVKLQRMVLAVRADGVAGCLNLASDTGVSRSHQTDHEESRLYTFAGEDAEDVVSARRKWTVVKSKDHLVVFER
jgi:hypothetical protein